MITSQVASEAVNLLQQGITTAKAGDKEAAKALLRRSAELDPNNEVVWLWLASLYTELSVISHCLQQVLVINPSNSQATQALQAVTQQLQQGQSQSQQVAQPGQAPTGDLLSTPDTNQWETQAQQFKQHAQQKAAPGDFEELKRRGIVEANAGHREEARQYFIAATDLNDSDPEVWMWLSTVIDDFDDKEIALDNVLALDPLNTPARTALDDLARARAEAAEAAKNPPPPPPQSEFELYSSGPLRTSGPLNSGPLHASGPLSARLASGPLNSGPLNSGSLNSGPLNSGSLNSGSLSSGSLNSGPLKLGSNSKLFAQTGKLENPAESSDSTGDLIIGGKYRVLSATDILEGVGYVVCETKPRRFYILRPQKEELVDRKRSGVNYLMHKGTPYTIVPISTNGLSLRAFTSSVGALPPDMVARYGLEMLKTLAAEHAKGPILTARKYVTPDTVAFNGTSQLLLEPPAEHIVNAKSSSMTTPFLPPEQAQHGRLAPTSDIFAVGAILFFMLTGSPPPPADSITKRHGDALVEDEFPGFPGIPQDMVRVLATALQPNPGDRYPSAVEMASALRNTAAGRTLPKELPMTTVLAVGAVLCVAMLGGLVASGKINIPFPSFNFINQSGPVLPTLTPTPVPPTPVPPPPLGRLTVNSVDSRHFPANTLFFSALDPAGAPMFGIGTPSIKLKENGVDVSSIQITELRRTVDAISVIVALDTGSNMAGKPMDDAKTAIHILADRLQPGDHMALVTFGGDAARLALDSTVSKAQFLAGVDGQNVGKSASSMVDAVNIASLSALTQLQGGYTVLVVVTNGGLPKGKLAAVKPSVDTMVKAATAVNLPIYVVATDKGNYNQEGMNQLAASTGGATFATAPDTGQIGEAVKQIEQQLHNVYKITYDSPSPSPQAAHEVELTLTWGPDTRSDKRTYQYWQK